MRRIYSLFSTFKKANYLLLLVSSLFVISTLNAQTTLINPATGGGFEIGADFTANGWTVVNGTVTNKWFVGSVPPGFNNRTAYISNDAAGATWNYLNTSASVVHFYRDITFPVGESDATLTFDWEALGETSSYDALMVSVAPTTYTPTASTTSLSTGPLASPASTLVQLWNQGTTVQSAIIKIPASLLNNCSAPVTLRIIFTWKNDGSGGTNPPAAIDNISLVSQNPSSTPGRITTAGGTFTINQAVANTGSNFTTFTEAVNALNGAANFCALFTSPVVFNVAANQTFNEIVPAITATGSVANNIIFQKSGSGANPVVMRNDPGTLTTSTFGGQGDAIISISGGDYITFNQIDVNASDQGIEYGYLLRKASGTDGCKNVTIKGATITMTKGTSVYVTGIYSSNLDATSAVGSAAGVTVSSTGGRSENITITGNTITNVYHGIYLRGFAAATPFDFYDQNFVVGAIGAGNGNTINNFGGQSTTVSYGIYAIQCNAVTASYNTINNLDNGGSNSTATMYGAYFITGTNSTLNAIKNNINLTSQYTSGSLYGIYNSSFTGNIALDSNTVSLNNTASSSGTFGFIYNGSATAATQVSISNNIFAPSQLTATGVTYLIYNSATNAAIVNVQANTNGTIQKDGNGTMYGYYNAASPTGTENFFNNNFSDITATGTSSFYGYYSSTAAAHRRNVYGNTFSNIAAGGTTVVGIFKGAGNSNIYRNKITGITGNSILTTAVLYGIQISSGVKDSIYNNIIGDLSAPTAATPVNAVAGIISTSTSTSSTIGIYYNTIYLSASSSGANFGTSGISLVGNATATTAAVEMKNNIIVNNSSPNGTGYTAVFRRVTASSLANLTTSTNNNLFYTQSPGGNTALYFYDATIADYTLQDFKNRVTPRGTATIFENPNFLSIVGTDPTYLHINAAIATQIESGGSAVGGITTDYDGQTRNVSTPDIGADEFTGIAADLTSPSISYTQLGNTICTDARTITATITDASGVNTAANTKPRLWYKKSTSNNVLPATNTSASNGWKWVEATNAVSPFTFTFNYSLLNSPLAANDSISYFIVAQDLATTPNVGANAATFNNTPASVALSAGSFPATGSIAGFRYLPVPTPLMVKADKANICASGTVTLDLDNVDASGATYQWQSSPAGTNTWAPIAGGTTIPFTSPVISASTDFRLLVFCGATPIASSPSNTVSVAVNNPALASTTPGNRCGPGTVSLGATAPGFDVKWYANASGGAALFTGSPFVTPAINSTTTYYAAAATPGSGAATNAIGAGATTSATYSNPFYSLWSNTHNQHMILASELSAAGILAGDMTALALNVTVAGTLPLIELSVKMGQTNATDVSTYVNTSFTTVFTSPSLMPVTGINTMTFTTPFAWDGASNIVIEICHGNPSSTATMNRTVLADNTTFTSSIHTHKTSSTGGTAQCTDATTNLTTYMVRPQFTITFQAGCTGTRTAVIATVNTPPTITVPTATPSTICEGQNSTLSTSSTNSGYTYSWTPGSLSGASVSVSPTATTKYYVNAVDNSAGTFAGCVNKDSVVVTVNPRPSVMSITPSSASVCPATEQAILLTANGGTLSSSFVSGTQANQNTATTFPSPFSNYWGGSRHQFLVLASELSSAGFAAGAPLTSITMDVVSLGTSFTNCESFKVKLGHTSNTSLTAFINGLTDYYGPTTVTPIVGTNEIVFTSSFVWNGTDNLVIETTFSNGNTGTTNHAVIMYNSPTAFQSTIVYRADGATPASVEAGTTVNNSFNARPDFTLGSTMPTTITWSPTTGLYTNAAATNAYAGGNTSSVYAKPIVNTVYTATSTSANSCTRTQTVTVNNSCPLPVTLVNFAGEKLGSMNKLQWTTANEINNAGFVLERSADGRNFSKLSFVVSQGDNGNSSRNLEYAYNDERPLSGNGYYRLKQVDKDGKYTYSNIVLLKGNKVTDISITSLYPNPAATEINLVISSPTSEKVTLVVTDMTGKIISQTNMQVSVGDNLQKLQVSQLASGTYFIKTICANGCESAVQKFVRQ